MIDAGLDSLRVSLVFLQRKTSRKQLLSSHGIGRSRSPRLVDAVGRHCGRYSTQIGEAHAIWPSSCCTLT